MARSHHRKKHKQWQPPSHTHSKLKKGASSTFAIVGAVVGLAIFYFASPGNILLIIAGLLVGGGAGYFIGRRIDQGDSKN
jgi:hypothetical protein